MVEVHDSQVVHVAWSATLPAERMVSHLFCSLLAPQVSNDGEVVVIHDSTVTRTTNGTGSVNDLRWEDYMEYLDAGSWKVRFLPATQINVVLHVYGSMADTRCMLVVDNTGC